MTVLINKKLYEMLKGWAKTAKLNKNGEIEFSYDSFFGDEEKKVAILPNGKIVEVYEAETEISEQILGLMRRFFE